MNKLRKDLFLSHAHVDKYTYVRPFAHELDARGISYWLDDAEIAWGDNITEKINEGLRKSDFVLIFLSENFIARSWTKAELSSALNLENSEGRKVVLPLIIGEANRLLEKFPLLRDKAYLHWDCGGLLVRTRLSSIDERRGFC